MKKKETMTKEELEREIRKCQRNLREANDQLIDAEIRGVYALLDEVRELLVERNTLLRKQEEEDSKLLTP